MADQTPLQIPVPGEGATTKMADVDPTIAKRMDMAFADQGEEFRSSANRAREGDAHVAELTRNAALQFQIIAGAHAAQGLAGDILAQRSAGQQPQAAGGPMPVKPATA